MLLPWEARPGLERQSRCLCLLGEWHSRCLEVDPGVCQEQPTLQAS